MHTVNKEFIYRIYKHSYKSIRKRELITKMGQGLNRLTEKIMKMPSKHTEIVH